jgi:hypothetical protein
VGVGVERDVQEHVGGVLTCGRGAAPGCGARWRGLSARTAARRPLGYSIPNGPGTIGGTRHDPKKHDPSPTRGTINSA